jgi:drug/metabolite transporter (DMT)-like permease
MSMTPVITLVLSALVLGERTNVIGLLGVAAGFLGVGVVAFTADRTIAAELLGVVFMLLGACAWSTGIVVMRRYARNIVPSTFVAWQTLFGVPVLFVLAFVFEGFVFEWSLIFVLAVLYAGVVSKGTSFFLQLRIVQLGTATTASLTAFLLPVFGTLAGVIVLGETVRAGQVAGGAVILVGVGLVLRSRDDGGVPTPLPRTPAT